MGQFKTVDDCIEHVLKVEGGYVDHPNDLGGPTMHGITEKKARLHGWQGPMRELPLHYAKMIYMHDFVFEPNFDKVANVSMAIAAELVEAGVNVGPGFPGRWLQEWLNLFNLQGKVYKDIPVDGKVGPTTIAALSSFLKHRGKDGERVMVEALNCSQGDRYRDITIAREKNEDFIFGWMLNRVAA